MADHLEYKGIIYKSFKACWKENAAEGLSYSLANSRRNNGLSIEEALTNPVKKNKQYIVDGDSYPSLSALARAFFIKRTTIQNRVKLGYSDEELIYGKDTGIRLGGVKYNSINQMCREHGVTSDVYHKRRIGGWTQEEALGLAKRAATVRSGNSFTVEGKEYPSIKAISKAYNVPFSTIRNRLAKGFTIEIALGLEPIPQAPPPKNIKEKKYEWKGNTYKSLRAVAEIVEIKEGTLRDRMKHNGFTLAEAINFEKSTLQSVVCHGVEFSSLKALAKNYNKDYYTLVQRINRYKFTPEDAINLRDTRDPVIVEGRAFKNFRDAARHYGIPLNAAALRLGRGSSAEEALELEGDGFVCKGVYNEKYFILHPEQAGEPALVYFIECTSKISDNTFQKIGITKRSIATRFQSGYQDYKIESLNLFHCTLREAYTLEQMLHSEFDSCSYLAPFDFSGRTECFRFNTEEISHVNKMIDSLKN